MRLGHGGIVDQMNEDTEKTRVVTKCKNDNTRDVLTFLLIYNTSLVCYGFVLCCNPSFSVSSLFDPQFHHAHAHMSIFQGVLGVLETT